MYPLPCASSGGQQVISGNVVGAEWSRVGRGSSRWPADGHCGESHGQADTDAAVLRAVSADLLFLPDVDAH